MKLSGFKCSTYQTHNFWPFALKAASRTQNHFTINTNGNSLTEQMSGITKPQELSNEHQLFCAVYVLKKKPQGFHGELPKRNPKANTGLHLVRCPL